MMPWVAVDGYEIKFAFLLLYDPNSPCSEIIIHAAIGRKLFSIPIQKSGVLLKEINYLKLTKIVQSALLFMERGSNFGV